jgi:hypothetical protein
MSIKYLFLWQMPFTRTVISVSFVILFLNCKSGELLVSLWYIYLYHHVKLLYNLRLWFSALKKELTSSSELCYLSAKLHGSVTSQKTTDLIIHCHENVRILHISQCDRAGMSNRGSPEGHMGHIRVVMRATHDMRPAGRMFEMPDIE